MLGKYIIHSEFKFDISCLNTRIMLRRVIEIFLMSFGLSALIGTIT